MELRTSYLFILFIADHVFNREPTMRRCALNVVWMWAGPMYLATMLISLACFKKLRSLKGNCFSQDRAKKKKTWMGKYYCSNYLSSDPATDMSHLKLRYWHSDWGAMNSYRLKPHQLLCLSCVCCIVTKCLQRAQGVTFHSDSPQTKAGDSFMKRHRPGSLQKH